MKSKEEIKECAIDLIEQHIWCESENIKVLNKRIKELSGWLDIPRPVEEGGLSEIAVLSDSFRTHYLHQQKVNILELVGRAESGKRDLETLLKYVEQL